MIHFWYDLSNLTYLGGPSPTQSKATLNFLIVEVFEKLGLNIIKVETSYSGIIDKQGIPQLLLADGGVFINGKRVTTLHFDENFFRPAKNLIYEAGFNLRTRFDLFY